MGVIKATLGDIYRSVNVQLVSALFQLMMSMGNKHLPSSPCPQVIRSWWFLLSPVSLFPSRKKSSRSRMSLSAGGPSLPVPCPSEVVLVIMGP